ncbi:MAG: shikimate kinase AroK [Legionellales bacterium]|nr:shikimate kinase AroK [Legionellales bacterium]|tara:strand:+ start:105 stop:638 length:534 start_codon:yes stop_codon:yes gene_type:complete
MKRPVNLFLVGPMGAGKSTIGRQLAKMLKMDFIDTDQEIEDRTGADIAWIFDVEGEAGFRARETQVLEELSGRQNLVLATGGGIILSPQNRNLLAARGLVVYLNTSVAQQLERTARDKRRPLLRQSELEEKKEELLRLNEIRQPLYEEIAEITVETDERSVRAVAKDVIDILEKESI